jgi:5-methylcytosine-specific restriction endonuclease McrA
LKIPSDRKCAKCGGGTPYVDKQGRAYWWNGLCYSCHKKSPKWKVYNRAKQKKNRKSPRYIAYQKKYRKSPKFVAYVKEYRKSPKFVAYVKEYAKLPKQKIYQKEYKKKWRQQNPEYQKQYEKLPKRIAYMKEYKKEYSKSPKWKTYMKGFRKSPTGVAIDKRHKAMRRSVVDRSFHRMTSIEWQGNLDLCTDLEGWLRCVTCGSKLVLRKIYDIGHANGSVHLAHLIPLSKGGTHSKENCWPSCPNCNLTLNATVVELWF